MAPGARKQFGAPREQMYRTEASTFNIVWTLLFGGAPSDSVPGVLTSLAPQYAPVRGINLEVKDCITSDMLTCSTTTRLSSRSRGVEEILGQWSRVSVKLS